MEWNWLDWALATIVLVSVAAAMWEGFVRELISLAAVVVGLTVAVLGYGRAGAWFEDLTRSDEVAQGLGFLTLFFGTVLVGAVISILAKKLVQKAGLGWFDRFLGGLFGLVRGVVICAVLLMAMVAFSIKRETVKKSTLSPYVVTGARVIGAVMPSDLKAQFQGGFEKFRQALIEQDKKTSKN
jgi:membrane protein required for colicin V production